MNVRKICVKKLCTFKTACLCPLFGVVKIIPLMSPKYARVGFVCFIVQTFYVFVVVIFALVSPELLA